MTNDLDKGVEYTYVDYPMGPPGTTSYQLLSPKHPGVVGVVQSKSSTGIPIYNVNGDRTSPNSNSSHPSVINMSTSLDKASFNKLRGLYLNTFFLPAFPSRVLCLGEPEGKERVRFADADGNTLYPGETETPVSGTLPNPHSHSNGKLPQQNGGPNYTGRFNTLPNKLTANNPPSGGVPPSQSMATPMGVTVLATSGANIPSSTSAPLSVQDHIYSTTSRVKPAPLPRAPSTNLSQSQLSSSSSSSNKSPPPLLPPAAANGPILKKTSRNTSDSISPPVSIEGDHKTLTLKCPSGYSITSV